MILFIFEYILIASALGVRALDTKEVLHSVNLVWEREPGQA
jgi:hypothetical protein